MKKTILFASLLLSTSVLASSSTTSKMFPISYVHSGQNVTVSSYHTYQITNDTDIPQAIEFCHEIATCVQWPYYVKAIHKCENFSLSPHETKTGSINMEMVINYPFQGWCKAVASTEIKGGTYNISSHEIDFQVGR